MSTLLGMVELLLVGAIPIGLYVFARHLYYYEPPARVEAPPQRGSIAWYRQQRETAQLELAEWGEIRSEEARQVWDDYQVWCQHPLRKVGTTGGPGWRGVDSPSDWHCFCGTYLAPYRYWVVGGDEFRWVRVPWERSERAMYFPVDSAEYGGLHGLEMRAFCCPDHMLRAGLPRGTKIEVHERPRERGIYGYGPKLLPGNVWFDWL